MSGSVHALAVKRRAVIALFHLWVVSRPFAQRKHLCLRNDITRNNFQGTHSRCAGDGQSGAMLRRRLGWRRW
ncbi:hypothetical protein DIQ79_23370 [Mycolicibacterium smegmatis]|uniref:Uncharacterized protein n=1 Tax=Mycolicibacterium smegmatis (strain ATCC 700084 / mc(2)155) TaxID=246196 RepID=A0QPM5_MYCS2|nr:hypothetical protein MSMEG_0450 [Mycolicibacterium smegmatis MC2 155]TBM44911.1 hypothetical protein DIQ86_16015 [Mycolicibacterium smegmatis]TBH33208.1 hypothetical protein EYS45_22080 [Mycolicibacterium smegmatis MC2 155]TBM48690.1 hypothetical protein DIQ85_23380 [Mycolicibacterium smegmatis]TBM58346.1 hypothetical protein DIQ83_22785 [Mycolicibacterium smegmatis]